MLIIPRRARAKVHLHESYETAIYVISGEGDMCYGESLEEQMLAKAGDYIYISAVVPHLPYNSSDSVDCVAVLACTDQNKQESVVLPPDLEGLR